MSMASTVQAPLCAEQGMRRVVDPVTGVRRRVSGDADRRRPRSTGSVEVGVGLLAPSPGRRGARAAGRRRRLPRPRRRTRWTTIDGRRRRGGRLRAGPAAVGGGRRGGLGGPRRGAARPAVGLVEAAALEDDPHAAEDLLHRLAAGRARGQRLVMERLDDVEVLRTVVTAVFVGGHATCSFRSGPSLQAGSLPE